ncbi:MAG: hypothetical protein A2X46_15275 [Lentisphaerae bacterium GWF2_57_35]|nr:MAG: hypothetical protein A2X46_15275 [Lentisphaerae bacterium GWF2_57_35]
MDTNALAWIHRTANLYTALKTMSVDVESAISIKAEGMRQEFVSRHHVSLERPDKLAVEHTYGVLGSTLVYRETNIVIYIPELKRYFEKEAPAGIDGLLTEEGLEISGVLDRAVPVLTTLISTNPYERIMQDNTEVKLLPSETIEGKEYVRLHLSEKLGSVELWIAVGEEPLLYKVEADVSQKMAEEQGVTEGEFEFKMTTLFTHWNLNRPIESRRFIFTPPPGALPGNMEEEADEESLFSDEPEGP